LRGEKIEATKRGRKFHHVNSAAAVTHGKNGTQKIAGEWYHGSMTGERFKLWLESSLLKNVNPGCPVIMDRASFHRKKQLEEMCVKAHVTDPAIVIMTNNKNINL
jgi:hypothetical protein